AASTRSRPLATERGQRERARPLTPHGFAVTAPTYWVRRAGASAVPRLHGQRDAQAGPQAQPELGRRCRARPDRASGPTARAEGRPAFRGTTGTDRPDAGACKAPRGAPPGRASRLSRPTGAARVPPVRD